MAVSFATNFTAQEQTLARLPRDKVLPPSAAIRRKHAVLLQKSRVRKQDI